MLQLLNKSIGVFDENDERVASALAAQCAVAVQRAQLTEALLLNERLDEEVSLAREIQMSTLPTEMPDVPGYDLHGQFLPTGHAGGDLFDLVVLDGQLFILMGDATGHGFGPALSATQMQAMLRVAFRCGADLDEAYRHVNNQLEEDLPDDRFVTAFMGFLDPQRHVIRYHSGGQGPILHFRAAGESVRMASADHLSRRHPGRSTRPTRPRCSKWRREMSWCCCRMESMSLRTARAPSSARSGSLSC